jgi:hypothetical protein
VYGVLKRYFRPSLDAPITMKITVKINNIWILKVEEFEIVFVLNNYQNKDLVPDSLFLFSDG